MAERIRGSRQLGGALLLTYRELMATWVALALLAVTTLGWVLLALTLSLDIVEGSISALRIFGLETTPMQPVKDPETGEWIREAMSLDRWMFEVNGFVFGATFLLGTLLGLFAAIPLTVDWMGAGRIELMLAKPISRVRLLAGHAVGVWLTAATIAAYLIISIWLTLSIKSGVWSMHFLIGLPLIFGMFAVMYGAALVLATRVRSAAFSLIATYGLIFFSIVFATHEELLPQLGQVGRGVFLTLYHTLPNFMEVMVIGVKLIQKTPVDSWYPLFSSLLFGAACYLLAAGLFARRDF